MRLIEFILLNVIKICNKLKIWLIISVNVSVNIEGKVNRI